MEKEIAFTEEEIRTAYGKFNITENMQEELDAFLERRNAFFKDASDDNLFHLRRAFENLYTDTKLASHMKIMSERDFYELAEMLKRGV